jgi:alkaline phosphatase
MNFDVQPTVSGRRGLLKTACLGALASAFGTRQAGSAPAVGTRVRGVVFLVADGMSPGVFTLAQAYSKLTRGKGTAWWGLHQAAGSARGLMDTASANSLVTDSAAASSAWGGGRRVANGSINTGVDGRESEPVAAALKRLSGARVGLVTTATVTHATPAGFAAVVPQRGLQAEIAPQYLGRVDVLLGGGSVFFDAASRSDGRDLRGDFVKAGYQNVADRAALLAARGGRLIGTFSRDHLPFSIDRAHAAALQAGIPTLAEMSRAALARFLEGDRPFLLQVEGARIDHAAHLNDIGGLLGEQLAFDDALATVLEMTRGRDDVLVVVTSDHGNANPGLNGIGGAYESSTACFETIRACKASHEWIFAEWGKVARRDAAALTGHVRKHLGFHLEAGEAEALLGVLQKRDVVEWNHLLDNPEGLLGQISGNRTGIGWTGTTHTSDPTLITATGPQAQRFAGMVTNSEVFGHLVELLG